MKIDSRFLRQLSGSDVVRFTFNGKPVEARRGDTVAAALLGHSSEKTRLSAKDAPRGPYCMMGVCFECRVEVDGRPNTQGCMLQVQDGMQIRSQDDLRRFERVT